MLDIKLLRQKPDWAKAKLAARGVKAEKIDEEEYCIKEGLEFGEEIVLNGNYELQEGEKILIRNK